MANHTEFVLLAQELISEEGRVIALQKLSGEAANPDTPWKGTTVPTLELQVDDIKAVFLPASGNDFSSLSISKELLAEVTQVALVAPHAVDLSTMTMMLDGGVLYKIEWARVLKPADKICLYAFGVKQ